MGRPKKLRRICSMPRHTLFGPLNRDLESLECIKMSVDEYEVIRLIDLEGLTQEECARQMDIGRTTVQSIYSRARKKLAQVLVEDYILHITGGKFNLYHRHGRSEKCGKGCQNGRRGNYSRECRKKE